MVSGFRCSSEREEPVNKSQLIDTLATRFEGNRKAAAHALEAVLDTITREVAKGEKVAITGFGSFEKRVRGARTVRNPRTGEQIKTKKKAVPKFTPGADLKNVISGAKKLPKLTLAAAQSPVKTALQVAEAVVPGSTPAKRAPAKKAPAASKSSAAKKAPAKKTATAAKKTATASKSTAAKKAPAKKTSTASKSTAAKKAPAKKTTSASKTTTAKKAPAKRTSTASKSATAKKTSTAAKKAPAKKTATKKTAAKKS